MPVFFWLFVDIRTIRSFCSPRSFGLFLCKIRKVTTARNAIDLQVFWKGTINIEHAWQQFKIYWQWLTMEKSFDFLYTLGFLPITSHSRNITYHIKCYKHFRISFSSFLYIFDKVKIHISFKMGGAVIYLPMPMTLIFVDWLSWALIVWGESLHI